MTTTENTPRRPGKRAAKAGRWLALVGLGSAAVVAGLYVVGKRNASSSPFGASGGDGEADLDWDRDVPGEGEAKRALEPKAIPGPTGPLELLEVGGPPHRLPVLFIHGLGGRAEHWTPLLLALAGHRRAAAVGLRDHTAGAQDSPALAEADSSITALAEDLPVAARAAGFNRYLLVGHSLGAAVAAAHAAAHPGAVAGLLLVDPNGEQSQLPREEIRQFLDPVRADPHGELRFQFGQALLGGRSETADAVLAALEATPPSVLVGALESAATHSTVADIERYAGPTACVVTPLNSLPVSLHRLLPELPASTVYGASHWLMMDRPEELVRLLDLFLTRLEG